MKKIWNFLIASLTMVSIAAVSVSCGDDNEDENNTPGNESSDPSSPSNNAPSNNGNDNQASHEYVDLGLPSGTLWATCNIGATKPEEYGDYFAWGETEPKEVYDWSTYKWGDDEMTKYNSKDTLTTLLPEDDAATANWGSNWRMPTIEEQQELINNCEYSWTEVGGVYGAKFTGTNGASVFFPAAGYCSYSHFVDVGYAGYCLSSSLCVKVEEFCPPLRYEKVEYYANRLLFYENEAFWDHIDRCRGVNVRAVRAK